jgi:hypothetical protein
VLDARRSVRDHRFYDGGAVCVEGAKRQELFVDPEIRIREAVRNSSEGEVLELAECHQTIREVDRYVLVLADVDFESSCVAE